MSRLFAIIAVVVAMLAIATAATTDVNRNIKIANEGPARTPADSPVGTFDPALKRIISNNFRGARAARAAASAFGDAIRVTISGDAIGRQYEAYKARTQG